jgi:glucose/arabinose dehydrogenase
VLSGGERGLLSMAFHPDYQDNGRFFVDYTEDPSGRTVVAEYAVSADPDRADAGSARILLTQDQFAGNHNGGQLAFGPLDGYLYIGLGDGGGANDPQANGQDLDSWLATILRIDVDGAQPYQVPADNPFVDDGDPMTRDEIWSYGLRNPWRFAFDPVTADLYIADVGQNCWEEVSVEPALTGGLNHGWSILEGSICFVANRSCGQLEPCGSCPQVSDCSPFQMPAVEYSHDEGCSITGGFVYRGCRLPGYSGHYFYADYCTNLVRSFVMDNGMVTDQRDWTASMPEVSSPSSFGEDARGELYVVNLDGRVYRIVGR